jgi:hypothetical protein
VDDGRKERFYNQVVAAVGHLIIYIYAMFRFNLLTIEGFAMQQER